ncbi:MAG: serine protease [Bdellovibrionota bacterium]
MIRFTKPLFAVALVTSLYTMPVQASFRPFIVGGQDAAKGEFPFIVSMQDSSGSHFCGGSLIKKNWVLTAAHCVTEGSPAQVVIGLLDRTQPDSAVETFRIEQTIVHPKNDSSKMDYDFALLKLSGDSKFEPVSLNSEEIRGATDFVTAGWGTTADGGFELPNMLQKVTVPFVADDVCAKAYPGQTTDTMICAGLQQGGKDSCQGDSGGPLLMGSGADRKLVGVVSWGEGCARPDKFGVYGKVSAAAQWINDTAK